MTKRISKSADGLYHKNGKTYAAWKGSRAMVWHGTAYQTYGGLTKDKLHFNNKTGRIVSKKKHVTAKREKKLAKLGYKPVTGKPFTKMRRGSHHARTRTRRRR